MHPIHNCSELIRRLRALTLELLPLEVNLESINDPTSRIITPQVIVAYRAAAGDFVQAVSFFQRRIIVVLFIVVHVSRDSFHTAC